MNDGGPAFPCVEWEKVDNAESPFTQLQSITRNGMSLRDWFAGHGAPSLPYTADDELWSYIRANAGTVLEAVRDYDNYMRQRDLQHADAMLAERGTTPRQGI